MVNLDVYTTMLYKPSFMLVKLILQRPSKKGAFVTSIVLFYLRGTLRQF